MLGDNHSVVEGHPDCYGHAAYDGYYMIHTDDPEGYRLQPASLVSVFPGGGSAKSVEDLTEEDGLKAELRAAPRPTYKRSERPA